jgi:hypothetical protein
MNIESISRTAMHVRIGGASGNEKTGGWAITSQGSHHEYVFDEPVRRE